MMYALNFWVFITFGSFVIKKPELFIEVALDSVVITFQAEKVQVEIGNSDWLERSS